MDAARSVLQRICLVSFSLDRQPVAGWQIGPTDVGLPDYAPLGDLFASSGDKAYFLSESVPPCPGSCKPQEAWVYGIDTKTGARLFNPVPLPGYVYDVECFGNGPGVAVCLRDLTDLKVWVIDLERGALTFTGPTDLASSAFGKPEAQTVGTHLGQTRLVATVRDQGVYGRGVARRAHLVCPGQRILQPEGLSGGR